MRLRPGPVSRGLLLAPMRSRPRVCRAVAGHYRISSGDPAPQHRPPHRTDDSVCFAVRGASGCLTFPESAGQGHGTGDPHQERRRGGRTPAGRLHPVRGRMNVFDIAVAGTLREAREGEGKGEELPVTARRLVNRELARIIGSADGHVPPEELGMVPDGVTVEYGKLGERVDGISLTIAALLPRYRAGPVLRLPHPGADPGGREGGPLHRSGQGGRPDRQRRPPGQGRPAPDQERGEPDGHPPVPHTGEQAARSGRPAPRGRLRAFRR